MIITMKSLPINLLFYSSILFNTLTNHVIESTKNLNNNNPSSSSSSSHNQRSTLSDKDYDNFRPYTILTSQEIKSRMEGLAAKYHNLVTLDNAQERYGLPTAGLSADCPFDHEVNGDEEQDGGGTSSTIMAGCKNWFMTIEDGLAHQEGSESKRRLPEVFLSGALHGNERVGPTAVLEAATLLLQAASCEGKPSWTKQPADLETNPEKYEPQLKHARQCREKLLQRGIDDATRKWLARLVTTRRIVVVPTANALGYFRNRREEGFTDPNRDFPYDVTDPKACMQTICGRTVNEIYREHMFQLSLTFHAGMEIVSYEWGAPTWGKSKSPDDYAQVEIGNAYSHYAGKFDRTPIYPTGSMNDEVYPVRGGMEDWAYAGSWDHPRVIQCKPTEFGGYPPEKSVYNDSTLRAFNMLVETSDNKAPPSYLGSSDGLLDFVDTKGNGHIARNIRLALLAVELVEPYVSISKVNDLQLTDDIVPLTNRGKRSCQDSKLVKVPRNTETWITWSVGGGFTVDATAIFHANWNDVPEEIDGSMMKPIEIEKFANFQSSNTLKGLTQWHKDGTYQSSFKVSIDTSMYNPGDKVAVFASARLDQGWWNQPSTIMPRVKPTSHVVNARTNPTWHHESAGKIVEGRLDWFSIPLTLLIADDMDGDNVELSIRHASLNGGSSGSIGGGEENGDIDEMNHQHDISTPEEISPEEEPKYDVGMNDESSGMGVGGDKDEMIHQYDTSAHQSTPPEEEPESEEEEEEFDEQYEVSNEEPNEIPNEEPTEMEPKEVNQSPSNQSSSSQMKQADVKRRKHPNYIVIVIAIIAFFILFYRRRQIGGRMPLRRLPRYQRGLIGTNRIGSDDEEEFVFDNNFTDDEDIQLRQLS